MHVRNGVKAKLQRPTHVEEEEDDARRSTAGQEEVKKHEHVREEARRRWVHDWVREEEKKLGGGGGLHFYFKKIPRDIFVLTHNMLGAPTIMLGAPSMTHQNIVSKWLLCNTLAI